jgi:hypothetical protein
VRPSLQTKLRQCTPDLLRPRFVRAQVFCFCVVS